MNLRISIFALALLITITPAAAKQAQFTRVTECIKVAGVRRSFTVCFPNGCANRVVPLVIVLHGAMGNGWSAEYDSQMTPKALKEHFIVVYPNGTGSLRKLFLIWNVGPCSRITGWKEVDDLAFIRQMIAVLKNEYDIDPNRIYVTGLSNGGMLAYRIAAEMPNVVAAICPIACCMYDVPDRVASPVSVLVFHGTNDRVFPYGGGVGSFYGIRIKTRPVTEAIRYWAKWDQCYPIPIHEDFGLVARDRYGGGADNTEVCLYTIRNGGHSWPGGRSAFPLADRPQNCLSATDLMWDFFCQHPKQHGSENPLSLNRF